MYYTRGEINMEPNALTDRIHSNGDNPRAAKRPNSPRMQREHVGRKRTKVPDHGGSKVKPPHTTTKRLGREDTVFEKEPLNESQVMLFGSAKASLLTKAVVSISGDELALENPPSPSPPGIFKQLMDIVNRSNPREFVLPQEILSLTKEVAVNDGGGDEASAKPRTQPEVAIETTLAQPQAEESDLQQYEANGNVQPCHKCNSNPTRDQRMISCDFCPLHWHQSCLSPSMAPPSSGRHTWKCPSHADHTPRRSKRKGASPILAEYPNGSDNGSSDVVSDRDSPPQKREMLDADDRVLFRIPEQNIKLSFIDKCQK
ncbi:hypothetical protein BGX31_008681 [Mortierella sp. GBA43]|nr:hypothetical protein BGX31_008681 [Mortierella sp. GBA43]